MIHSVLLGELLARGFATFSVSRVMERDVPGTARVGDGYGSENLCEASVETKV
jgi:hypothetical protein